MALLDILFNNPTKAQFIVKKGPADFAFELDASINENHERTAEPTRSEIEDGATVSDHIKLNPKRITFTGLVSDSPIGFFSSVLGTGVAAATQAATQAVGGGLAAAAVGTVVGEGLGSLAGLLLGSPKDPKVAWKYLEELWKDRIPFDFVTALDRYENMIVQSLTAPRSAKQGKSLYFTCTLEEVRIVKNPSIPIPVTKLAEDAKRGASTAGVGRAANKAANSSQNANASILLQGLQNAGVLR